MIPKDLTHKVPDLEHAKYAVYGRILPYYMHL
jgi:hypothetical protein